LVHELVHALRMMEGKWNQQPTDDPHYDNVEEWAAILLANIYMSERGDHPLRASHSAYTALARGQDTSAGFFLTPENVLLMIRMYGQHTAVFDRIATQALAQPGPDEHEQLMK